MKKFFLLTVVIMTIAALFGCAPAAAPTTAPAAPAAPAATQPPAAAAKKTYADMTLCYPQLGAESDWRTANSASFKETAAKLGVKLIFSDAQQKQENQISAIRSCIQQGVNVIALPPVVETGIQNCGQKDGIYVVSINGTSIQENRIYFDDPPTDPWNRAFSGAAWNPSGVWISFVEEKDPEYAAPESRIMRISPEGRNKQLLVIARGRIETPVWLPEGNVIYYARIEHNESQITSLDINTGQTNGLGKLPGNAKIVSISPDGIWLVIVNADNLYIYDRVHGSLVETVQLEGEQDLGTAPEFLGWELCSK